MKVAILILSYDDIAMQQRCYDAVKSTTELWKPKIQVIDNTELNLNIHTRWNNFWRENPDAEYICYLTHDTVPHVNWLTHLLTVLDLTLPNIAVVGPSTNLCYNEQSGRIPEIVQNAVWAANDILPSFVPGVLLAGFCMVIRRSVLVELGGFREDFAFYGGDLDFMFRLRMAGHETAWVVPAFVWHDWGSAAHKKGEAWYTSKRELGNKQLSEAIAKYRGNPGVWVWDGKSVQRNRLGFNPDRMLAGEASVAAGRTHPLKEVMDEL